MVCTKTASNQFFFDNGTFAWFWYTVLKGTLLYSRRVDEEKNVIAEHINLSPVEFELFCGEKGWRKGEEEEGRRKSGPTFSYSFLMLGVERLLLLNCCCCSTVSKCINLSNCCYTNHIKFSLLAWGHTVSCTKLFCLKNEIGYWVTKLYPNENERSELFKRAERALNKLTDFLKLLDWMLPQKFRLSHLLYLRIPANSVRFRYDIVLNDI